MAGILFILKVIFIIIALCSVTAILVRATRNKKKWKAMEPEIMKDIQEAIGQEIVHTMTLNAGETTDFTNGKGFLLWIAFTADYIVFTNKDFMAHNGNGELYYSRRTATSMKRLKKKFMELEFTNEKSAEKSKLTVFVSPSDIEILGAFIPNKKA